MEILVNIIVTVILLVALWRILAAIFWKVSYWLQIIMRFGVVFMSFAVCYILYTALCADRIGSFELALVLGGLVYSVGAILIALVVRFVQSIFHGYEDTGLGDLMVDSWGAGLIAQVGPAIILIIRVLQMSNRSASAEPAAVFFIKAILLSSIVSVYGTVLILINSKCRNYDVDLFDPRNHPGAPGPYEYRYDEQGNLEEVIYHPEDEPEYDDYREHRINDWPDDEDGWDAWRWNAD